MESRDATEYLDEGRDRLPLDDRRSSWSVSASVILDGPGTGGSGDDGGRDGGGLYETPGDGVGGMNDGGAGNASMRRGRWGLRTAIVGEVGGGGAMVVVVVVVADVAGWVVVAALDELDVVPGVVGVVVGVVDEAGKSCECFPEPLPIRV